MRGYKIGDMKRIIVLGVCLMSLYAIAAAQVPYSVKGTWREGAGRQVILQLCEDGELKTVSLDSVAVASDGTFSLKGTVPQTGYGSLYVKGKTGATRMLFFDGSPVEVLVKDTTETVLGRVKPATVIRLVKGNKEQLAADAMFSYYVRSFTNNFSEGFAKSFLEKETDEHKKDSLRNVIRKLEFSMDSLLADYKVRYADCYVAPYFIELNMLRPCTTEQIDDFFNHLSGPVKASAKGKEINARLVSMKKLAPGAPAPDFTLATADGKTLSLKDLRGKIVLIDFWASWCAPCMGEMPNVKNLYAKYHGRGLEVVGISMDHKKEAWLKGIGKEQLPWLQVSSLKGMGRCPVAKAYEVLAIPKFYIIDREGRIVAKDLRGEELAEKVASLFAGE